MKVLLTNTVQFLNLKYLITLVLHIRLHNYEYIRDIQKFWLIFSFANSLLKCIINSL